jgi:hypothetical protein
VVIPGNFNYRTAMGRGVLGRQKPTIFLPEISCGYGMAV